MACENEEGWDLSETHLLVHADNILCDNINAIYIKALLEASKKVDTV
jgi:hypothetical protein